MSARFRRIALLTGASQLAVRTPEPCTGTETRNPLLAPAFDLPAQLRREGAL